MAKDSSIIINMDGETFKFKMSPTETILDSALDNDIDLPYSCQSGVCSACQGKVITGTVSLAHSVDQAIFTVAKEVYVYVRNTGTSATANDEIQIKIGGNAVMILTFGQFAFFPVKASQAFVIGSAAGSGSLKANADYAYFTESP